MEKEKFQVHENLRHQVEYSKSARSSCKKCKGTIAADSIRVGTETPSRVFDGFDVKFTHLKCFDFQKAKIFYINQLKHYELLRWSDQLAIRTLLNQTDDGLDLTLSAYYNEVWRIKDILNNELKPAVLKKLFLEFYPKLDSLSPNYNVHFIADGLAYGRIGPCPLCNGLTVLYDGKNYYCRGHSSSFSRCNWHGKDVKRYRFAISNEKNVWPKCNYFKDFQYSHIHPHEILEYDPTTASNLNSAESIIPTFSALSTDEQYELRTNTTSGQDEPRPFTIRNDKVNNPSSIILKVDSSFSKLAKGEIVQIDRTHLGEGWVVYNVSMNLTDLMNNNNSFYILQIIQVAKIYWVYCKWGRIGQSSNGGTMEHQHSTLSNAVDEFSERFKDKTGVEWSDRFNYKKQPSKYNVIDIEESSNTSTSAVSTGDSSVNPFNKPSFNLVPSKLSIPVQELVNSLFDIDAINRQLTALSFDVKRMPLGQISKKTIALAYKVLNEIEDLQNKQQEQLELKSLASPQTLHTLKAQLLEVSARFYTLVPHFFEGGLSARIPPIDTRELLVKSIRLVDTLGEIEVVNNLKSLANTSSGNSLDDNYNLLKSDIQPLDQSSLLYRNISEFAMSTVDPTVGIDFEIQDIFTVSRHGDDKFTFSQGEFNRNLLYHGSRITNWIGILSNGLRIAPAEAPQTGYSLGKGIYLADAISVSGGYCGVGKGQSAVAVIAICDVACGNSSVVYQNTFVTPDSLATQGYHSTKAIGKRQPALYDTLDGCYQDADQFTPSTILKGPIIETGGVVSTFTHNEYVVYNTNQCKIKYLLKLKLNFN